MSECKSLRSQPEPSGGGKEYFFPHAASSDAVGMCGGPHGRPARVHVHMHMHMCVRTHVACVRMCVRACVRVCACVCVYARAPVVPHTRTCSAHIRAYTLRQTPEHPHTHLGHLWPAFHCWPVVSSTWVIVSRGLALCHRRRRGRGLHRCDLSYCSAGPSGAPTRGRAPDTDT